MILLSDRPWEIWDENHVTRLLSNVWGKPGYERGRHWELNKWIADMIEEDSVLEVAPGMGHLYFMIKDKTDYRGRDTSQAMIDKFLEFFPEANVKYGDAYDLSEEDPADIVICIDLLMHLPEEDMEHVIRQLWSRTGKLLIFTMRMSDESWCSRRQWIRAGNGNTIIEEPKYLILRAETLDHIHDIIGRLDGIAKSEDVYFDERTTIFKVWRSEAESEREEKMEEIVEELKEEIWFPPDSPKTYLPEEPLFPIPMRFPPERIIEKAVRAAPSPEEPEPETPQPKVFEEASMEVIAVIPITKGEWMRADKPHGDEWFGFYFGEFMIDWSLFSDCYGKLYIETMHSDGLQPPKGGTIRLASQQQPAKYIPVEGSEIDTYAKVPARWQLLESDWFRLPEEPGVSCVWVEGRPLPGRECLLALATLVIAREG